MVEKKEKKKGNKRRLKKRKIPLPNSPSTPLHKRKFE